MHISPRLKNNGLNFLLGASLILALAPFYILPLLVLSLSGLLWQIHSAPHFKTALRRAYFFGLGYYFIGLSWIIYAFTFLPQALQPFSGFLLGFPSVLALSAALSLFMVVFAALSRLLPHKGLKGLMAQAGLWFCIGFIQGHIFTGFPWNPLAISLTFHPIFIQPAAFVGMYGLSFIAAAIGCSYYALKGKAFTKAWLAFILALLLIFCLSALRYFYYDSRLEQAPVIAKLRAIQSGITVDKKWDERFEEENFNRIVRLMNEGDADYDAVILGETALPLFIGIKTGDLAGLSQYLPHDNSYLLMGINRVNADFSLIKNAFVAADKQGDIVHSYSKSHLVPFGEYVPKWIPFQKFTSLNNGFVRGDGPQSYQLPAFSYGPNICYEGIFQGEVIDYANKPDVMINAAIDSWYGNTHGPRQHAAQQKIRAVEEGLPMVRVTDNGISFAVNGIGKIEKQLPINDVGYFDYNLKKMPITSFSGKKSKLIFVIALMMLAVSLYCEYKKLAKK